MPTVYSKEMYRGEDVILHFSLDPASVPAEGIGSWVIHFNMVRCDGSGTPIPGASKLGAVVCSITDPAAGTFSALVASAYTASADVGLYRWDVRRQGVGQKATLSGGTIRLKQEVVP
jgi:hypothetical protein